MWRCLASTCLSAVLLSACGVTDGPVDRSGALRHGPLPEADDLTGAASPDAAPSPDSVPADDTTMPPPVPICQQACIVAEDCVPPLAGRAFDADNWACVRGVCKALGCKGDAECADLLPGYVCRDPGSGVPVCSQACAAPVDCVPPVTLPGFDASHFACNSGACTYLGCLTDGDCSLVGESQVCRPTGSGWLQTCVSTCTGAEDCVGPGAPAWHDLDNVACNRGICTYLGCRSTAECLSLAPGFVCAPPPL